MFVLIFFYMINNNDACSTLHYILVFILFYLHCGIFLYNALAFFIFKPLE